jgi:hypothetical protein
MTTTVQKQVLINARALIAEPARWTNGTLACDAEGQRVAWHDPFAAKWCAHGAIYRAAYDLVGDPEEATRIGDEVVKIVRPPGWLRPSHVVNDARGHAVVLAIFDKALQAA